MEGKKEWLATEAKAEAHAMLNGEETGLSYYMSIDTGDFVRCMAIMHEIGKSMMLLDGEKIRATIEGGAEKTIIKVRTSE
ncbi:MAG: hypothetical protein IKR28_09225 [Selenomonadaceae bacterium]|nr:hypothetical protein [Selenomonadaceae bacterium]